MTACSNKADTITLQDDLDRLQKWEKDWLMSFNPDKCEVIRITNKRNIINSSYTIHVYLDFIPLM